MSEPGGPERLWRRLQILGASVLALGALALGVSLPAKAQTVTDVSEICADPMTGAERKRTILNAAGWSAADPGTAPVGGIARVHIPTFTGGLVDFQARLDLAPEMAGNLARMIDTGAADLLALNGHYLFMLSEDTAAGFEHLTCLYAAPPTDAMFAAMEAQGTPDDQTYPGYAVLQRNDRAVPGPDGRSFDMVSIWSRLDLPPDTTDRLTDAYRLERVEAPAN